MDLAEIVKRTDRQQTDIEDIRGRVTELEKALHGDKIHRGNVERRLSNIEDTLKWIVRLIIGGIILGLIAIIMQGNGALVVP